MNTLDELDAARCTALSSGANRGIVFDPRPLGSSPYRDAGFPFKDLPK